ncbi:MAG: diacylglycerol kinase family protein [Candidatus Krumholzibacteriota bacterium]
MTGFLKGFVYAWKGLAAGARGRNFRVMLAVAAVVILLGFTLDISGEQWCLVSLSMGLVLGLELVNTAGEKLVDILSPDHDPRYGLVKDILAGAVLVAALAAAVVGALVFLPRIL